MCVCVCVCEVVQRRTLHMDEQRQDDQVEPITQQLCADTGCISEDMPEAMDDREGW